MEMSFLSTCGSPGDCTWHSNQGHFGGGGWTAENPPRHLCSSKGVATFTTEQS